MHRDFEFIEYFHMRIKLYLTFQSMNRCNSIARVSMHLVLI
jgi:hypothetical protein